MDFKKRCIKHFLFIICCVLSLNPSFLYSVEILTQKQLADVVPAGQSFIRKTEPFGHFLAYSKAGDFAGAAFLTTEVVPDETWGYRGQIEILIGIDTQGTITGVTVLEKSETQKYIKGSLNDGAWFLEQFISKDSNDAFILEGDVDAITGATITSSTVNHSIKEALDLVAEKILNLNVREDAPFTSLFFHAFYMQIDFLIVWLILCLSLLAFFKKGYLRYCVLGMSFLYIGFFMKGGLSLNDIIRLLSFQYPLFLNNFYWYSIVGIAIVSTIIAGRFFCGWLCPFGAFSEFLNCIVPFNLHISEKADHYLKTAKYIILAVILLSVLLFINNNFAYGLIDVFEPFSTFFTLHGSLLSWIWLVLMLVLTSLIPRFYCKYFCPLGALFAITTLISCKLKLNILTVDLPKCDCEGCRWAERNCKVGALKYNGAENKPDINNMECFMCNNCASYCPVTSPAICSLEGEKLPYFLRKNGLILITCISLTLNVIAGILLYKNAGIISSTTDVHEKQTTQVEFIDYDAFQKEWGDSWIGIEVDIVTPEVAALKNLPRAEGAYVTTVAPGSPADKADIDPTDVILSFNGRKIRTPDQFGNDLYGTSPGTEIFMCIAKNDYRITVTVTVQERPSYLPPVERQFPYFGIEVAQVQFGSNEEDRLEEADKSGGVVVAKVIPDSPAEKAGVEESDIIMSFNSRKTRTLREFLSDLASCQAGDLVRICLIREDYRKTLYIVLGDLPPETEG